MKLYVFLIIVSVLFLLFVEKYIGNVSIRPNSNNINQFNLMGAISYMLEPLHNTFLWNMSLLPYNYVFIIVLSVIVHTNLIHKNKFE